MAGIFRDGIDRRSLLAGLGAGAATLSAPSVLRAQTRELVVGGAASHKPWVEAHVAPLFERKYNAKLTFEGTRSLVNLEKMQKNKDQQYLSVVQMDDPGHDPRRRRTACWRRSRRPRPAEHRQPETGHRPHGRPCGLNYLQPWLGIAYNPKAMKTAADLVGRRLRSRSTRAG